jgi:hypothetical protein
MKRVAALALVALVASIGTGCASPRVARTEVLLSDDAVTITPASVKAGPIRLRIDNIGPSAMRLVLVKADRPLSDYALGADGEFDVKRYTTVDRTPVMKKGRYLSEIPVVGEGDYYVLAAGSGRLLNTKLHVRPNPDLTNFYNR